MEKDRTKTNNAHHGWHEDGMNTHNRHIESPLVLNHAVSVHTNMTCNVHQKMDRHRQ